MNAYKVTSSGNVTNGPSKAEIMLGLSDNPCDPQASGRPFRRITEFPAVTSDGVVGKLKMVILSVSVESGDGTILNIEGYAVDEASTSRDIMVWVCFDTKNRKGPYKMHNPEKYREGKLYGMPHNIKAGDSLDLRFWDNPIALHVHIKSLETWDGLVLAQAIAEDDLGEDSEWYPINLLFCLGDDHAELVSLGTRNREFPLVSWQIPKEGEPWRVSIMRQSDELLHPLQYDLRVKTVVKQDGKLFVTGHIPSSLSFEISVNAEPMGPKGGYSGTIRFKSCFD